MKQCVRAAILAWLSSRALLFALLIVGSAIAFVGKVYSGSVWETRVVLQRQRIVPSLILTSMTGDAWWYRSIALHGYERRPFTATPPANWAFFPLYPLAVRTLGGDFAIDGLLLSNAALLGALLLLPYVLVGSGATTDDASRAVFYLAFFPTSYFLSFPLPESLFLLLTLGAFLAAQRERWWLAGVLGGLAALTRINGVLLLPALALVAFERAAWRRWQLLWLLLIPAGTAIFMTHLHAVCGNAFAFAGLQANWGRHVAAFWQPLLAYVRAPAVAGEPWNLIAFNFAAALLALIAAVWCFVRRQWAFGTYAAASVLLPLSSGSLQSIGRYATVVFPVFLVLATIGRRPLVDRPQFATTVILMGWFIALLTLHVDFALA